MSSTFKRRDRAPRGRFGITADSITPHFQPIVELQTARVVGYEVLSRGPAGLESPAAMFDEAERTDTMWELERACRTAALRRIASLTSGNQDVKFFLNISPRVIRDPRFVSGFTRAALAQFGVGQSRIVLEITEKETVADYARFEQVTKHYRDQGFEIALDDFGSGHSGLLTLISCAPQFIKLDMELVRDVHLSPYKQHILSAVVGLARSVHATLVAEGIEQTAELRQLVVQGVQCGQGWLLARPAPEPPPVTATAMELIHGLQLVRRSSGEMLMSDAATFPHRW